MLNTREAFNQLKDRHRKQYRRYEEWNAKSVDAPEMDKRALSLSALKFTCVDFRLLSFTADSSLCWKYLPAKKRKAVNQSEKNNRSWNSKIHLCPDAEKFRCCGETEKVLIMSCRFVRDKQHIRVVVALRIFLIFVKGNEIIGDRKSLKKERTNNRQ